MENLKKSFVVYLDAYPHVLTLTPEERGQLFTCLFWYAGNAAGREHPMDVTAAGAQCRELSPRALMCFYFMADAIARDTEKWGEKRKSYQRSAAKRLERRQAFQGPGVDVYPTKAEEKALLGD
ncbi:DUF6291 domain-containing protein [uncultured Dysosmobacter sp.]|uniref:DUF6291 domain-containing protein n=1 Tax=uncultured Dysosmobacter sp. TaxID=2591384 RepID=UPI00260F1407|nr:DUF6291 domain-containing protein [uncultured Dysosmobacter sp.]